MEALLATPITPFDFLVSKMLPYFILGMGAMGLSVAFAVFGFGVPFRGSILALVILSSAYLAVMLALGLIISTVLKNQLAASQAALVTGFLPAFLLSGFIFAIDNMPAVLQYLTYAVPARYYVSLSRLIFLKGLSPLLVWGEVAALGAMVLILVRVTFVRAGRLGLLP